MKYQWVGIAALVCTLFGGMAQEKPKPNEEVKVRVIRQKDGKTTVEERIISAEGMSPEERTKQIEMVVDTVTKGPKKRVKVIVEDGKEAEIRIQETEDDVFLFREPRRGRFQMEFDADQFRNRMRRLGDELPEKMEQFGPIYRWDNQLMRDWGQTPFRGVEVYPNKPANEVLNVRFYAEKSGDVIIRVLDIQGKEVASETIRDHQGEFIGQIRLKRQANGTYFVLLTQGNDGVSRRVVL